MKAKLKLIKTWMFIGLRSSPFSFTSAILSRVGLAAIYYFIMLNVRNLVDGFGTYESSNIMYYIVCLLILALISAVLLIIQDVNDTYLNTKHKELYTEKIIHGIFDADIINLQREEYQNQLSYAIQAMNGTQLFSPTLAIINMILGSISNVLIVITTINYIQYYFVFTFLLFVFIIAMILGEKISKKNFKKEEVTIPLQREKSNCFNVLTSNHYFQENFIYNFTEYIVDKWHKTSHDINNIQRSQNKIINIETLVIDLVIASVLGTTLIVLAKNEVALTAGSVVVLIGAITSLLQGIRGISSYITNFLRGVATLEKVEKMKKYNFINHESIDLANFISKSTNDDINIFNLSFAYPNNESMTISNVNLKIKKGKVTAIVGENGCGKTTLIKLIAGIYKPDSGAVIIDGQNTYDAFNNYHSNLGISVIFQNYGQYQGITLQENINFGDIEIVENEHVNESIYNEFKDRYKEIIGNSFGGIDFSGGQWQKIALLRALVKDNEILIFDEPTASLDPISEKNVYNWLIKESTGKTLIIVSHRLGSIKNADEIVVMDNGRITEKGNHDKLIRNKGKYFDMFEAQAQWYKGDVNV